MNRPVDRRSFLGAAAGLTASMALANTGGLWAAALEPPKGSPNAEKIGWRLGCQAYSFNRFSFYEAVDKTASLGLRWIEAYPGQKMSQEQPGVQINESLPPAARAEVKKKLADCGVTLVNYGVCGLGTDKEANRRVFEFAKDMGIETIVSEPPFNAFDVIEPLCDEYGINVALHNHPEPSRYWKPDTVLEQCKGRSKRIGACADTGHWMRSGIKPVEALKQLEGRIISFHFKDLNRYGHGAHDVPWGTGEGDVKASLAEVYRQGIKAVFSIEYEHNWDNSVPEIAQCVAYFDQAAEKLAAGK